MKKLYLLLSLVLCSICILAQTNPHHVWVRGHWRGSTWVDGYYRTAPNHTNVDNFSTKGNINPYTGKSGTVSPDGQENPWQAKSKEEATYIVQPYASNTSPSHDVDHSRVLESENAVAINSSLSSVSKWYCKGNQVNVRFAANTSSRIAFRLDKGDELEVLGKSMTKDFIDGYGTAYWYEVKSQNLTGWVFGGLIGQRDYDNTSPVEWDGAFLVIDADNVNVRSEPSTQYGAIKFRVNKNEKVEVIAKTKNMYYVNGYGEDYWYYIKYEDSQGWVFGKLTTF